MQPPTDHPSRESKESKKKNQKKGGRAGRRSQLTRSLDRAPTPLYLSSLQLVAAPYPGGPDAAATATGADGSFCYGLDGPVESVPAGYSLETMVFYGSGVNSAMKAFGESSRQRYLALALFARGALKTTVGPSSPRSGLLGRTLPLPSHTTHDPPSPAPHGLSLSIFSLVLSLFLFALCPCLSRLFSRSSFSSFSLRIMVGWLVLSFSLSLSLYFSFPLSLPL